MMTESITSETNFSQDDDLEVETIEGDEDIET
jgi:hypothetical protein